MIPVFIGVFYVSDNTISLHHKHLFSTFIFWLAAITDWLDGYHCPCLEPDLRIWRIPGSGGGQADGGRGADRAGQAESRRCHSSPSSSSDVKLPSPPCANGWRNWAAAKSIAVSMLGKFKTTFQMIAILFLLYHEPVFGLLDAVMGNIADLSGRRAHVVVHGVLPDAGDAADHKEITRVKLIFFAVPCIVRGLRGVA